MLHLTCGVRRQSTFGGQLSPARSGRDVSRRLSLSVEHPSVGPVERPHVPVALELLWLERDVAVRGALGFVPVDDAVVAHLSERVVHDPTGRVVALAVAQQARVGAVVLLQQLCPLLGLGGVSSGACLGDHRLGGRAHLGANALDFGQQLRVADVESCLLDDVLGRPHAEVGQAQWVVDVEPAAELSGAEHAGRGLIAEMESELSGLELIELRAGAVINLERAAFAVAHGTVAEPALEVLVSHLWRQLGLPFLGSSQHLLTSGVFCFPRPRDGGALGLGRLLQRAKVRRRVEHRLLPSLPLQVRRELGFVERAVGGDGQLAADEPTQGVLDLVAREPVGHGLPERRVAPAALRHEPAQVRDVELLGRKRHRTRLQVVEVLCLLGGFTGLVVALRCTSGCVLGGILGLLPLPHRVRWQIEASVEDAWIAGVEGAAAVQVVGFPVTFEVFWRPIPGGIKFSFQRRRLCACDGAAVLAGELVGGREHFIKQTGGSFFHPKQFADGEYKLAPERFGAAHSRTGRTAAQIRLKYGIRVCFRDHLVYARHAIMLTCSRTVERKISVDGVQFVYAFTSSGGQHLWVGFCKMELVVRGSMCQFMQHGLHVIGQIVGVGGNPHLAGPELASFNLTALEQPASCGSLVLKPFRIHNLERGTVVELLGKPTRHVSECFVRRMLGNNLCSAFGGTGAAEFFVPSVRDRLKRSQSFSERILLFGQLDGLFRSIAVLTHQFSSTSLRFRSSDLHIKSVDLVGQHIELAIQLAMLCLQQCEFVLNVATQVSNPDTAAFAVAHGTVAEPALEVLVSHLWRQLGLPFLGSSQHLLTSGVFCFPRPRDGGALGLGRLLQRAKVRRRVEHRLLPSLPLQVRRELGFVERAVGGDGQLAADEPTQGVLDLVAREPVGHGLPERRVAPAALRHEPAQVRDVELLGRKRHRTRLQVVEVLCLLGGFTGLVVALRCTSGCVLGGILGLLPLPHRVRWQIEASVEDAWIAGVEGAAVEDRLDGGRVHDLQFTLTVAEPAHAGANDRVVAAFARQDVDGLALVSVINPGVAELAAVGVLFDHLANPLLDLRVVHIENLLSADVEGLRLPEARGILLARREVVAITEIATSVAVRVQLLASLICLLGAGPKHGIVRVHL